MQSTLLLRSWALNPVLMRQLFQQLNGTDHVTQAVYARVAVMPSLEPIKACMLIGSFKAVMYQCIPQRSMPAVTSIAAVTARCALTLGSLTSMLRWPSARPLSQ